MGLLLTICKYFLWFILYSVGGWIMETILYMVVQRRVVKRGFLFGPLCPIYGVGAILATVTLYDRVDNIFLLFLIGMVMCTTLEYVTHFVLEKLFHTTWWDYSNKRFNIKGRICLKNSLLFGVGIVLIVRVFQPAIIYATDQIPDTAILWISFVIYSILLIDLATTVSGLKNTVEQLKDFQKLIGGHMQKGLDTTDERISELAERLKASEALTDVLDRLRSTKSPLGRLHDRYPNISFNRYKDVLQFIYGKQEEVHEKRAEKRKEKAESKENNEEKK